jgi:hypothetical protein
MVRLGLAAFALTISSMIGYVHGQSHLVNKGVSGCSASKKCSVCQGDCDSDNDCKAGLQCFQRDDATIIHGCMKGGTGDVKTYDYCYNPTLKVHFGVNGCTAAKKCGQCQGDCDRDTDCKKGLRCWQRNNKVPAHGCKSGGKGDVNGWDYCYSPSVMHSKGVSGCRSNAKCSKCQGDCDRDTDCKAGLKCFQRNDLRVIPGCKAGTVMDVRGYDYCYSQTTLFNRGVSGCTPTHKCKICQGDCDKDIDCMPGLKCFQRNGMQQIHGCSKGGKGDTKGYE